MQQQKYIEELAEGISFEMVFVEGGIFMMGSEEKEAFDSEKPVHKVEVPEFYIATFPLTQKVYEFVIGKNPSDFKGEERPVEVVSWEEAKIFIENINQITGKKYRLPSETEWEFAARGGNESEGLLYAGSDMLQEVGWFDENSGDETHPVGQKMPNELGLYDMSGNVWEWCEDDWHGKYDEAPSDGSAWIDQPERGRYRVLRGGGWLDGARNCRATVRDSLEPGDRGSFIGFRLACSSF